MITSGLSRHPALAQRAAEYGSRLRHRRRRLSPGVRHNCRAHLPAWKRRLAALKGCDGRHAPCQRLAGQCRRCWARCCVSLPGKDAMLFSDELNHNSLVQGARHGRHPKPIRFRHNDMDDLARCLARGGCGQHPASRFIVTRKRCSPWMATARICPPCAGSPQAHGAFLYVDEAHATGALGVDRHGPVRAGQPGIDLIMGTFSKALGSFGAYVAGSAPLIAFLQNACAGFVSIPPPCRRPCWAPSMRRLISCRACTPNAAHLAGAGGPACATGFASHRHRYRRLHHPDRAGHGGVRRHGRRGGSGRPPAARRHPGHSHSGRRQSRPAPAASASRLSAKHTVRRYRHGWS